MLKSNLVLDQLSNKLQSIVNKVINQERITEKEGIILYIEAPLSLLGTLANTIREQKNGNTTYFNKNIHIEPTNICVFDCKFCAYSRLLSKKSEAWEYTIDEMVEILQKHESKKITEVHLVGGVHPKMGLYYFIDLIRKICNISDNFLDNNSNSFELVKFTKDRLGHDIRYSIDSFKLQKLGWKKVNSFDKSLEKTIKWYIDNPNWLN